MKQQYISSVRNKMLWKQELTRTEQKWLKMEGIKTG